MYIAISDLCYEIKNDYVPSVNLAVYNSKTHHKEGACIEKLQNHIFIDIIHSHHTEASKTDIDLCWTKHSVTA